MNNSLNPMLKFLNQSKGLSQQQPNNFHQIKSMMNILQNSNNPQMLLQQLMQNNPRTQEIMSYINQNGGNPKAAFYKMAEQKGINPDLVINMLNQ